MKVGPPSVKIPTVAQNLAESKPSSMTRSTFPTETGKQRATHRPTPGTNASFQGLRNRAPSQLPISNDPPTIHAPPALRQSGPSSEPGGQPQNIRRQPQSAFSSLSQDLGTPFQPGNAEAQLSAVFDSYTDAVSDWANQQAVDADPPLLKDFVMRTMKDGALPLSTAQLNSMHRTISILGAISKLDQQDPKITMMCEVFKECIEDMLRPETCKTGLSIMLTSLKSLNTANSDASVVLGGVMRFATLVAPSATSPEEAGATEKKPVGTRYEAALATVIGAMPEAQWNAMATLHGLDRLAALRDVLHDYIQILPAVHEALPALRNTFEFAVTLVATLERKEMERLQEKPDSLRLSGRIGDTVSHTATRGELAQAVADVFNLKTGLLDVELVKTSQMSHRFKSALSKVIANSIKQEATLKQKISVDGIELPLCEQFRRDHIRELQWLESEPLVTNMDATPDEKHLEIFHKLSQYTNNNHKQIMAISVIASQYGAGSFPIIDQEQHVLKLGKTGLTANKEFLGDGEVGIGAINNTSTSHMISRAKDGRIRVFTMLTAEHFGFVLPETGFTGIQKEDSRFRAEFEFLISDDGTVTVGKDVGVFLHGTRGELNEPGPG
ncbi:MAG: hypothetical protein JWQ23_2240 [Herminiimonas sp.]|nr:hypothetical protein [Herminiimonas sp.]